MTRLRIKHFGPIGHGLSDDEGWMEIKPVTVFIGNQGSGKSTLAKLFSTFCWIEKALVRGDYDKKWFERKGRFRSQFLSYHRLEHYLETRHGDQAVLEYEGKAHTLRYANGQLTISDADSAGYALPQVMYVPAERNFISYVRNPRELKLSSESLKEFLTAFDQAKDNLRGTLKLPINQSEVEYDKLNDVLNLRGTDYKLRLTDASSGFQSFVPVYLVSRYLAETVQTQRRQSQPMSIDELERFKKGVQSVFTNDSLTEEQKRAALSVLSSRFNKTAFINIVEEPEQNLFPSSQWEVLQSLLALNAQSERNLLMLTTHSPYIVNYLSLAIQGEQLRQRLMDAQRGDLLPMLYQIVPEQVLLAAEDVVIYQCNEQSGSISRLPSFEGIPSDRNVLNQWLCEGNTLFDRLLELEEAI